MRTRIALVALWLAATIASAAVAWAVVSATGVRGEDAPLSPLGSAAVALLPTVQPPVTVDPTTTAAPTTTVASTMVALTTVPSVVTTTSTTSITTTTVSVATTIVASETSVHRFAGGTLVLRRQGDAVLFVSATPDGGFSVEIKATGPPIVVVEFDGPMEIHVTAKVIGGELVTRTTTESE